MKQKFIDYLDSVEYKGFDPYDGLNSPIIQKTFLKNWPLFRLIWIQFFKKSPINFRFITRVKKNYNPKGLGLFLTGYCNLYWQTKDEKYIKKIKFFIN